MRRITTLLACGVLAVGLAGCQKDGGAGLAEKLDQIDKRLASIEKNLASGGGAARPGPRGKNQRRPQRPRPDAKTTYSVPVEGSPSTGAATAKVTIVKGFEFACPFCMRVIPTLDQIKKEYGNDVRIVYKNFIVHPSTATIPALASCAAHLQGKYDQMAKLIWEKGFKANRNLSKDNMLALAKEAGLDMSKFTKDLDGPQCKKKVRQDQAELAKVGTTGTPAFYINGRFLSGARPFDQFKVLIDEELKKADQRIKGGTPAAKYYQEWVVKKGKKAL
ncbi:MAG: DsbA family protein [Deltaproteobacteria bacterium]|nr:DsbA family protein [Deltaproteobacteria bacterium]